MWQVVFAVHQLYIVPTEMLMSHHTEYASDVENLTTKDLRLRFSGENKNVTSFVLKIV